MTTCDARGMGRRVPDACRVMSQKLFSLSAFGYALLILLACVSTARAQTDDIPRKLPDGYDRSLKAAGIPSSASAVVVEPLGITGLRVAYNAKVPMSPASTMKLVTTYAALRMLGPAWTWRTDVFLLGARENGVVLGDLAIRGMGDPRLVIEQLWLLVERIRGLGIREIRGDLVLDKSAFVPLKHDPEAFDGSGLRTYNVGPDALLLNYKSTMFSFVPEPDTRTARVIVIPAMAGMKISQTIKASDGACGDWQGKLRADFSIPLAPVFRGAFPLSCGERNWNVGLLDHTAYFGEVFRALWQKSGGVWTGRVRDGAVTPNAVLIATHESPALAEVVRDINKYSNNVMAQQVFLTIGAQRFGVPASFSLSSDAVHIFMLENGLDIPELVLENGAGLSRIERISAGHLAAMLENAFQSPAMPEFLASLPLVGVDGTARRRKGAAGYAHIKTGMLNDVRAIAGYVLAESGKRYVLVALINHPNAGAAQLAHDALLEWVYREG